MCKAEGVCPRINRLVYMQAQDDENLQKMILKNHYVQFVCCDVAAYVCGERGGLILEDPHQFGVSLNGVRGLDIEMEKKKVEEKLNELKEEGATEHDIELAMKNLGSKRFVPTEVYL